MLLFSRGRRALCSYYWCRAPAERNGRSIAAGGARAQGAGRFYPASWGSQRFGGRAGSRPKLDIEMTIGGDRPPKLCRNIVTFVDMREFLFAYLEYEQQMPVANEDGGDRVLTWRLELADSATKMTATDEFYDVKPCIDLPELDLKKVLETFSGGDVQQTSHVDRFRQIFRVLKMDASVPVDGRVFMQKRALRKYLSDCGLTDVVNPGDRQYTLKRGKVLIEAIAAGIEPPQYRRKVEREIRFNLVIHDPDALL